MNCLYGVLFVTIVFTFRDVKVQLKESDRPSLCFWPCFLEFLFVQPKPTLNFEHQMHRLVSALRCHKSFNFRISNCRAENFIPRLRLWPKRRLVVERSNQASPLYWVPISIYNWARDPSIILIKYHSGGRGGWQGGQWIGSTSLYYISLSLGFGNI